MVWHSHGTQTRHDHHLLIKGGNRPYMHPEGDPGTKLMTAARTRACSTRLIKNSTRGGTWKRGVPLPRTSPVKQARHFPKWATPEAV